MRDVVFNSCIAKQGNLFFSPSHDFNKNFLGPLGKRQGLLYSIVDLLIVIILTFYRPSERSSVKDKIYGLPLLCMRIFFQSKNTKRSAVKNFWQMKGWLKDLTLDSKNANFRILTDNENIQPFQHECVNDGKRTRLTNVTFFTSESFTDI